MKELKDIVKAFELAEQRAIRSALATVVYVEGSSYRRAGARMLVTEDGQLTGAISGGCLEGDALRKARLVMVQQKPMLVTYDTTDEDDAKLGVGLGCNGIIHILIEPIDVKAANHPVNLFNIFLSKREPVVLITLFSLNDKQAPQPGTCALLDYNKKLTGAFPDKAIQEALLIDAQDVLKNGNSVTKTYIYEDKYTCFIELLQPEVSLIVIGAGNDAIPLTAMATILGWQVTVIDGRANYVVKERFPNAGKLIVAKPEGALRGIDIDNRTVFVLMTHNYNYDMAMLRQLLPMHLTYIGALGPKKRLNRMLDEIRETDKSIANGDSNNVYGPSGLDIGSENADEIALSIIAEIQAVLKRRNGASLRYKTVVHNRQDEQILQQVLPDTKL
ncbi:XdhC family protein [Mucilaginibacter segetis]|uniref:XdhC family protein n=1 Tax=Mucilaginibacter segetis TaxID=2793071 RepID=A0A934PSY9_9SPHI|nr:XdhC/CoxI family protein [Mucilaginibacter segetis]MBK0379037.1 XdhC family protein [Mucilaginibacter segetis]